MGRYDDGNNNRNNSNNDSTLKTAVIIIITLVIGQISVKAYEEYRARVILEELTTAFIGKSKRTKKIEEAMMLERKRQEGIRLAEQERKEIIIQKEQEIIKAEREKFFKVYNKKLTEFNKTYKKPKECNKYDREWHIYVKCLNHKIEAKNKYLLENKVQPLTEWAKY